MYPTPSSAQKSTLLLAKGDRIIYQGESTLRDGSQWLNVIHLLRRRNPHQEEAREGWVPAQIASNVSSVKSEGNVFRKQAAIRSVLKWKARLQARQLAHTMPVLQKITRHNTYQVDKLLHILVMAGITSTLFMIFLVLGGAKWPTLVATLLTSNALGVLNEVLDYWTGAGDFELRDIYANFTGSLVPVVVFFLCWSGLERISEYRRISKMPASL